MGEEDKRIEVKFSHDYPKLGATKEATLLDVWVLNSKQFSKDFVNYDTLYMTDEGIGQYQLPKGRVLVLLLHSPEAFLFTTVRRYTPEKEKYYRLHIGELVNIIREKVGGDK